MPSNQNAAASDGLKEALHRLGYQDKSVVVADLHGTLVYPSSSLGSEMASLIIDLLGKKKLAIITGDSFDRMKSRVLSHLPNAPKALENLYLLPTNGQSLYVFRDGAWRQLYGENLDGKEREKITSAFKEVLTKLGISLSDSEKGPRIIDMGPLITFNATGPGDSQEALRSWDPGRGKRTAIADALKALLPEFEVVISGPISVDVTRQGRNKGYGVSMLKEKFGYDFNDMVFVGDSLYKGGNDYPVKILGVDCISVRGPEETRIVLQSIIDRSAVRGAKLKT